MIMLDAYTGSHLTEVFTTLNTNVLDAQVSLLLWKGYFWFLYGILKWNHKYGNEIHQSSGIEMNKIKFEE